jgi:2-polyprenyl-3-methyl-5-hydroxy-6-metoxy-1,4-benzoquinol methylase
MTHPVCPACNGHASRRLELVEVAEQNRDFSPENQETQLALNKAAAETALHYSMFKCDHCGIEYSDPMRAPSAEWYQLVYEALDLFPADRWEFHEVLRRIPKGEHLFEFGCGSGSFLERCKRAGVLASGMDFSADAVASCRSKGLDVSRIDLNSMNDAGCSPCFPQIAAFHFLEHVERPMSLFAHAAARARKGAHLWLSVPSDQRATRRLGLRDFLDQPPHHMTRWTLKAFQEVGNQHSWRLVEIVYEPIALRRAVWSITAYSPRYQRWEAAGRFKNRIVEKAYRGGTLPIALLRRLLRFRDMSGFSMLAHFVYEEG